MQMRLVALTALWLMAAGEANADADTLSKTFKRVDDSVVVIRTEHQEVVTGPKMQRVSLPGLGSGVIISADGKVMTAAHVVQTADVVRVEFAGGDTIPAKVISSDPSADVALLQMEKAPAKLVVATLGNSDAAEVGDPVFIVGAPVGMSHTLTVGHISARRTPPTLLGGLARSEFFQTDAAINQGNSGGPMFNMSGEVIGIVNHIISKSGGFEGLGFVVTSNLARRLLLERHAFWSGVEGFLLSGDFARIFNVPQKAGLLVQRVAANSPAAKIGLRAGTMAAIIEGEPLIVGGDVILEIQGVPVIEEGGSYPVIRDRLAGLGTGDKIIMVVLRGGRKEELTTTLP
ncbi:MAG TPA: trypsin-like peptidase domain-containing protein [Nitrospiraceae bacterium]|nr:trypsin-like peptidase domain-containing protein [Nitrospiraceae bacterium]